MLEAHVQARRDRIVMRVDQASPQVERLFQLTGAARLFGLAEVV